MEANRSLCGGQLELVHIHLDFIISHMQFAPLGVCVRPLEVCAHTLKVCANPNNSTYILAPFVYKTNKTNRLIAKWPPLQPGKIEAK